MPYLIPNHEALQKRASLRAADAFGREAAENLVVTDMAKLAGAMLAGHMSPADYDGIVKMAHRCSAGEISPEEFDAELEKLGFGWLRGLGRGIASGARSTGRTVGKLFKRAPKPRVSGRRLVEAKRSAQAAQQAAKAPARAKAVGQQMGKQVQQAKLPQRPIRVGSSTPKPKAPAPSAGQVKPPAHPYRTPATSQRGGMANQRLKIQQTPQGVKASPMGQGATGAGAPGRVKPAPQQGQLELPGMGTRQVAPAPVSAKYPGTAPHAPAPAAKAPAQSPGKVQPAAKAQQPAGQVQPAAQAAQGAQGAQTSAQQVAQQTASDKATGAASDAARWSQGSGVLPTAWRWRRPLVFGGIAAGLYGAGKGAQWAARQLEATSTTPQTHGTPGGWSPIGYGYGASPYGNMPTMGAGG